jgi:hypothetical protein
MAQMLYDEATHDTHLLRFRCQRYARHGWTVERESADHRSVIMRRSTRPWLSRNVIKRLFNVTWVGTDEYIELFLDAQRRIRVRPYQP